MNIVKRFDTVFKIALKEAAFEFAASKQSGYLHIGISMSAEVLIKGIPGGKPMTMDLKGQYTTGKELSITAAAHSWFGQDPVWVMLGIRKSLAEGSPGKTKFAVALMMPKGLDLKNLPGLSTLKGMEGLPRLTRTEVWLSNFDGTMELPNENNAMVEYDFHSGSGVEWTVESGCVVPADGPLKMFTGGKEIEATLQGRLNFATGDFYLKVDAEGAVGLNAGGLSVEATQLHVLVQVGPKPVGWYGGRVAGGNSTREVEMAGDGREELLAADTELREEKSFKINVVANGSLTLPFNVGSGTAGVSLRWNNDEIHFEGNGQGTLFNTEGTLVFGARKKFKGSNTKADLYFLASLPHGVKLANLPGLDSIPGIDQAPALAKGAKIGYSTFGGPIIQLNMGELKGMLQDAATKLTKLGQEAASAIGQGKMGDLMKIKDQAIEEAKSAYGKVASSEELLLADEGEGELMDAGGECSGVCAVQKQAASAMSNVAETGKKFAEAQVGAAKAKMEGLVKGGAAEGNKATAAALSAALAESQKAKKWLKEQRIQVMGNGTDVMIAEAEKAAKAAAGKVEAIFNKLAMGGSVQDAFKDAWKLAQDGASQLVYYTHHLDQVKAWLLKMVPGFVIPRTQGIIPASTGIGHAHCFS